MLTTGVIGLGMIGGGVATCLARENSLTAVFDVRADAADNLPGVPACTKSVGDLARQCNVVIIAVVSADQVRDLFSGADGLLANAQPETVVILQSTLSLPDLKEISTMANKAGVTVVDCGVTGGQAAADNGLVSLVGAEDTVFERIKPVLDGYSKTVAHMGGPGAGMAAKIARNVIVYNVWRAGYEGAQLAQAAGVDVRKLAKAIDSSAEGVGGPTTWMNRDSEPDTDPQEKGLREHVLTMLDKDLSAALELAGAVGVDLPMAELARASAKTMLRME